MKLLSIEANPSTLSKLKRGLMAKIKKGTGMNLIVHPENYKIAHRAFDMGKAVQISLTPEEIEDNLTLSPEQHMRMAEEQEDDEHFEPSAISGGSLFSRVKRFSKSKHGRTLRKNLSKVGSHLKEGAKEYAHQQLAEAHMRGAEHVGDNIHAQRAYSALGNVGHDFISGMGVSGYKALQIANLATAKANAELAKMRSASIHGMQHAPLIKHYYDGLNAPPSRGTGFHNVSGRGTIINKVNGLPPALQSQPYGANFHMQFQLPPQYKKYNDGTHTIGSGLYL